MKIIRLTILIMICLSACRQEEKNGSLSGTLKNAQDGTVLSIRNLENGQIIKKVTIVDGKFYITFHLSQPNLCGIWSDNPRYEKDRFLLWLENSKISMEGNYDYLINSKVRGSVSNTIFLKHDSICQKYNNEYTRLRVLKSRTSDIKILDSIADASDILLSSYRDAKISFYTNQIKSEVALFYLYEQTVGADINNYGINVLSKKDIGMLYQLLPVNFKTSKYGKILNEYISLPDSPKDGEKFIDFEQKTPEGSLTSVSENLGKFTILEFWASSCGPCRIEHPIMKKLYEKYHERGLNIIGISGDNGKDEWINAIETDSIPWLNISDLRGFNNKAFMIYGIRYIPRLFLIDQNGIILDVNLATKPLETEVEEIFKDNGL
jgi:thiol-disulfide isomerase/thioredoxin